MGDRCADRRDTAPVLASNWTLWLIASPLIMTASYGGLRVLMALLTQWRDGIFAQVAMHAVRKLASSPSSTCTSCRCVFTWSARPAA